MLIGLLALATTSLASIVPVQSRSQGQFQAFRLGFDIHRGDNTYDTSPDYKPEVRKRDGSVEMVISNQRTFYMASLAVGSNRNNVSVLVDTGSSDFWLMSHDVDCVAAATSYSKRDVVISPFPGADDLSTTNQKAAVDAAAEEKDDCVFFCGSDTDTLTASTVVIGGGHVGGESSTVRATGSNTCTQYGSFDTSESSSFKSNDSAPDFSIVYGDQTSANGTWGYDTVVISNATIHDLSFAVVNQTDSNVGVLGIGLPGLETTYSSGGTSRYQYDNLPLKMKNSGLIAKSAFSLYLGEATASSGTVLFGAVDHAKYSGQLTTVPIINTLKSWGYNQPIRLDVAVDGIYINDSSTDYTITSNTYSALLDSGSTLSYFPVALIRRLGETLGGSYSSTIGAYVINCFDDDSVTFTIDFNGATVAVPLPNLVMRYGSTCILGVLPQSSSYILFGDNVLRSAYLVYNLDDYEISIAQAKYTKDEDIEVISDSVPSAVRAAGYSSTAISAVTESSAAAALRSGSSSSTRSGSQSSSSSTSSKSSESPSTFDYRTLVYVTGMAFASVIFLL